MRHRISAHWRFGALIAGCVAFGAASDVLAQSASDAAAALARARSWAYQL